ncbi:MAG: Peptidyl-prolyl cis-trans isomerase [Candidatus Moranbacteria bacterium GW2011_GWD2_37_9]|nr:MAG: Peptidyl-prolyl cis-trans isomerase [Candidatus Moranbacteria bacterium GW2011_GWD2_37_9]
MLKRILLTASVLIFAVGLISNAAPAAEKKIKVKGDSELEKLKNTKAVIETKYGNIEIRFFPDAAPNHVKNFMKLSKEGVYDGTIFHRVIPGFMIQGGDPNTKGPNKAAYGMGGPGYNVNAEFNKISHKRGIVSMARSMHPDSAGSQFFIVVADSTFLDGQYTVFGEVTKGIEVADKIVNLPRNANDLPDERVEMKVKIIE